MDTWNRLTAVRGKEGGGDQMREGEGISQRSYMCDPWTQMTVCGDGLREQRGNNGGICKRLNNKGNKVFKKPDLNIKVEG